MEWMAKNPERRKDPSLLFEGAKTVIVLALNYFPKELSNLKKMELVNLQSMLGEMITTMSLIRNLFVFLKR